MFLDPLICEASRPAVDALPPELRAGLAAHWRRRARSELRISHGFARIAPLLADVGVAPGLIAHCWHAVGEEQAHAELCRQLVELYAGASEPAIELGETVELPDFGIADPRLTAALLIVGTCCINETLATAYIAACLDASQVPCAVHANRIHLREEIGHGRLGWAVLASPWLSTELRDALIPCLPGMLAANVPLWLRPAPHLPAAGIPGFGHPAHADVCAMITRTVHEVIVPGFAYVGVPYHGPREPWLRSTGPQ